MYFLYRAELPVQELGNHVGKVIHHDPIRLELWMKLGASYSFFGEAFGSFTYICDTLLVQHVSKSQFLQIEYIIQHEADGNLGGIRSASIP